jgi:cellulose synthase/poly-beta-1,6-N-acetylglucosamine synthase-like glycosyltransferase
MRVNEPTCTVVICTRDRPEELDRCLRAVRKIDYSSFEVLVVDNAPRKAPAREAAECSATRYVIEPVSGLSRARNRGALESTSDLIAYIDDDAIPEPRWLSSIASAFEDPRVMAAAGRVIPSQSSQTNSSVSLPGMREGRPQWVVDLNNPYWFEIANFGGIGGGANMAFRRSAFAEWPGFDIRLGRGAVIDGGEEDYAFFSLIDRGFSVVYTPQAVVRHPIPNTLEEIRSAHLRALATISAYIIFLFFDQPRYRMRLLRYIARGVLSVPRVWSDEKITAPARLAPRSREMLARLSGLWLFGKASLACTRASIGPQVAK